MSDVEIIPDHADQAIARLVDQFSNATKLQALISALCEPIQDVENALEQLRQGRTIDTAVGDALDQIGAIVGQPREGRDDTTYRLWIGARVLANRSTGTPDDTLKVLDLIAQSTTRRITEYTASYAVLVYALLSDADQVWRILNQIKPAGVQFWLESSPYAETALLRFADDDTPEALDSAVGLAPDDESTGGRLADVVG